MAFVIPVALAGLSYLVGGKPRITTHSIQSGQLGYQPRSSTKSTIPTSHIKQAPAYSLPTLTFVEADNKRIAEQLILVEAAADAYEERNSKRQASDPEVQKLLKIVTDFIKSRGLVVYGGT